MGTIAKYKVGVGRAVKGGPTRWLTLILATPVGDLREVTLFFYEKEPPNAGFVNRRSGCVVANLQASDFAPIYQLVQTEKPLFVHWRIDPDEERLIGIDVSTSDEPLGEGLVDTSP